MIFENENKSCRALTEQTDKEKLCLNLFTLSIYKENSDKIERNWNNSYTKYFCDFQTDHNYREYQVNILPEQIDLPET